MRCSLLLSSHSVAIVFLTIVNTSFSSPTNRDPHKSSISPHNIPPASLDIPDPQAIARSSHASHDRHLRHKRAMLTPSNHPSPYLLQRHDHIMDRLQLHTKHSSLAERGLVRDLAVLGFKLIWEHADVVVSSTLAYYRTTEFYKNLTIILGPEFELGPDRSFVVAYGVFRLIFEPAADAVTTIYGEIFRDIRDGYGPFMAGIGPFMAGFAEVMLGLMESVIFVTFRVLVWSVTTAWWITMIIVDRGDIPEVITPP
ncbi:hypothetical protein BDR22DRAFT_862746 [Usnea florida]